MGTKAQKKTTGTRTKEQKKGKARVQEVLFTGKFKAKLKTKGGKEMKLYEELRDYYFNKHHNVVLSDIRKKVMRMRGKLLLTPYEENTCRKFYQTIIRWKDNSNKKEEATE